MAKQKMKRIYMPGGAVPADREIIGCWLYQCDSLIFIGEKCPKYRIEYSKGSMSIKEVGAAWWVNHIKGKTWEARTGWPMEQIILYFKMMLGMLERGEIGK